MYAGHYVCACHKINMLTTYILFKQSSLNNKKSNYINNPRTYATTDIVSGNNTRVGTANECYTGKKVHIINRCIYSNDFIDNRDITYGTAFSYTTE